MVQIKKQSNEIKTEIYPNQIESKQNKHNTPGKIQKDVAKIVSTLNLDNNQSFVITPDYIQQSEFSYFENVSLFLKCDSYFKFNFDTRKINYYHAFLQHTIINFVSFFLII